MKKQAVQVLFTWALPEGMWVDFADGRRTWLHDKGGQNEVTAWDEWRRLAIRRPGLWTSKTHNKRIM